MKISHNNHFNSKKTTNYNYHINFSPTEAVTELWNFFQFKLKKEPIQWSKQQNAPKEHDVNCNYIFHFLPKFSFKSNNLMPNLMNLKLHLQMLI